MTRFDTATVSWSTIREAIVARAADLIASGEEFGAAERQATQEAIGDRPLPIREAQLVAMRTLIRKRVKDAGTVAAFEAFERQHGDRTGGLLEQVARSCATAERIRADLNGGAAMGFSMNMYIDYATRTSVEATRAAYRAASPAILAEIDLAMAQAYNAAKLPAHATSVAVEEGIAEIKARHDRDSDGEGALACLRVLYRLATTPTSRSMVCEAAEWVKGQQEQITYEAAAADKRAWMFEH